ncbi:hypothetical protein V1477_010105 [Vespula maculifrons]|uniref:Uncharacterized protein n=1 Tax=Vespula maculifrons TaxID=7453 RepID=A0ABD2CBN3_VESMC
MLDVNVKRIGPCTWADISRANIIGKFIKAKRKAESTVAIASKIWTRVQEDNAKNAIKKLERTELILNGAFGVFDVVLP